MRRALFVSPLLFAAALATACSEATDSVDTGPTPPADAGVHPDAAAPDATEPDAGAAPDAEMPDLGPPDTGIPPFDFGTKLAEAPSDLVAITPNESEVIFLSRMEGPEKLYGIDPSAPAGTAPREIMAHAPHNPFTTADSATLGILHTRENLWVFTEVLRAIGVAGKVRTYNTDTRAVSTLTDRSAKDLLYISPDSTWAITTDGFEQESANRTSTSTADLVAVSADGQQQATLIGNISTGVWDSGEQEYLGPCVPAVTWTSSTTAAFVACPALSKPGDPYVPTLYVTDLATGTTSSVAENASRFLVASPRGDFFFWSDRTGQVYTTESDGSNVRTFDDPDGFISEIQFVDDDRFVWNNSDDDLKIASYPTMAATTLTAVGAENLRRVSPTGEYVLFSQSDDFISDMYMVSTSTNPVGDVVALETPGVSYPGDDAFSADGNRVFWYRRTNPNLIGDIMSRSVDANDEMELVRQAYWVFNYANPSRVVLLTNARAVDQQRIICDLATRARDGSGELETVAGDAQCAPRDFAIFPTTRRISYYVPDGDNAGIWVRDLP